MSPAVALAAVLSAAYILVGALDLGVGLLLTLVARGRDRDAVLALGGRFWSGGAVWTLMGFGLVVAGLPGSVAALRALWPALVLMLLSLGLRACLATLRPHVLRQDLVDLGFGLASLFAAVCQGMILGWANGGLGKSLPPRHAGPFGSLSIWGLLCAAALVGLYALVGSGWLVWSGRDAVRVFGREVGRAAALLFAASVVLCTIWAVPTGIAAHAFSRNWEQGASVAVFGLASLVLLALFLSSLWGRRLAMPFTCAALAAICCLIALAGLAAPNEQEPATLSLSAAYLALVLLIGSPLVMVDLLRRALALRRAESTAAVQDVSHAGRRAGSLANNLHLS